MMERALLVFALCLCAGAQAGDFGRVTHIAVSGPENPDHVAVRDPSLAHNLFYSLGHPSDQGPSAEFTPESSEFNAQLDDRNVRLGAELHTAVVAAMRRDGYAVQDEPSYNTDGALNLEIERADYDALGGVKMLTPHIVLHARFVDMNSHDILFDKRYVLAVPKLFGTTFPPDPRYAFPDYEAILADPDRAIAGLRSAIPLFTDAIEADLKK